MPTKLNRYTVTLPKETEEFVIRAAAAEMRPVATQIAFFVEQERLRILRQITAQNAGSRAVRDESIDYDAPPPPPASLSEDRVHGPKGKQ